jgi:hypothetical protein
MQHLNSAGKLLFLTDDLYRLFACIKCMKIHFYLNFVTALTLSLSGGRAVGKAVANELGDDTSRSHERGRLI